jgi:hypothetical protein
LALALYQVAYLRQGQIGLHDGLTAVATSMLMGWLYAGTAVILWHAVRRSVWMIEPGEWVIMLVAVLATVLLAMDILQHGVLELHGRWDERIRMLLLMPVACLMGAVSFVQRQRPGWCGLFAALCCVLLLGVLSDLSRHLGRPWAAGHQDAEPLVFAVLLFWALTMLIRGVAGDLRRGEARHWLHWSAIVPLGVLLLFASFGAVLVFFSP